MTMHTEGPWSVAETRHNYDTVIRGPKGEPIALALIAGYTKQEGAANTALLAAAPAVSLCSDIDAAIARATGEQA